MKFPTTPLGLIGWIVGGIIGLNIIGGIIGVVINAIGNAQIRKAEEEERELHKRFYPDCPKYTNIP